MQASTSRYQAVFDPEDETATDEEAFLEAQRQLKARRQTTRDPDDFPQDGGDEEAMGGEEELEEEEITVEHMQEVLPGLWIGDIIAARDEAGLKAAGISSIVSILKQKVDYPPSVKSYALPVDDAPHSDILSHLPECVGWIQAALDEATQDGLQGQGGVLVHCQAGMSRSATIVAAYLMQTLDISPDEAIAMIKEKRPIIEPSQTFYEQLQVYYAASCRVSNKDRTTRQWYLDRTAEQVMNQGEAPDLDHAAKYPATPTASTPATPLGGVGRRKIRCKMCRRHLATREHMMDHILDQSPVSRPRTPSVSSVHMLPAPLASITEVSPSGGQRSRPPSVSSINKPVITQSRSRQSSLSHGAIDSPGTMTPLTPDDPPTMPHSISDGIVQGRKHIDPATLAARLPPQLAALRAGVPGRASPTGMASPMAMSPRSESPGPMTSGITGQVIQDSDDDATPSEGVRQAGRRLSMLAMTSSVPSSLAMDRRGSNASIPEGGDSAVADSPVAPAPRKNSFGAGPVSLPILVNPKCSGYFVEPLTWMDPMLEEGAVEGKLFCPNEKCKAKIGTYDWAGIQCGCKQAWITPGFCIHRSKVDEIW